MWQRLRHFSDKVGVSLLFVCGLASIVLTIAHMFHLWPLMLEELEPTWVVIGLLGLLSLSISLERFAHLNTLEKTGQRTLEVLRNLATRTPAGLIIRGKQEMYTKAAIPMVSGAEQRICAVLFADAPKAPPQYAETIARRLNELNESGDPGQFDTVIVLDSNRRSGNFELAFQERRKIYQDAGVDEYSRVRVIECEQSFGFDVLIVDERHAIIAFSPTVGTDVQQVAIVFRDDPTVAKSLAKWFDQKVFPQGMPIDDWLRRSPRTQPS